MAIRSPASLAGQRANGGEHASILKSLRGFWAAIPEVITSLRTGSTTTCLKNEVIGNLAVVAENRTLRALRDLPPASSIYQLRNEHEILDGDL